MFILIVVHLKHCVTMFLSCSDIDDCHGQCLNGGTCVVSIYTSDEQCYFLYLYFDESFCCLSRCVEFNKHDVERVIRR